MSRAKSCKAWPTVSWFSRPQSRDKNEGLEHRFIVHDKDGEVNRKCSVDSSLSEPVFFIVSEIIKRLEIFRRSASDQVKRVFNVLR
jgi:hypothetical protein